MTIEEYNQGISLYNRLLDAVVLHEPFRYQVIQYHIGHKTLIIQAQQLDPINDDIANSWYITFSPVHTMYLCPSWDNANLDLLDYEQAHEYMNQLQVLVEAPLPGLVFRALPQGNRILIRCSSISVSDTISDELVLK